jgi:hypothetical protein
VGAVTCIRNDQKRAIQHWYWHAANAIWWTEGNLIPPTIKAAGTPRKRCGRQSHREHPRLQWEGCSLPVTPSQDFPSWQCYEATHKNRSTQAVSDTLRCTGLSATMGEMSAPFPWGTTNKYQVSQLRLLVQTVHLWMTCSK